MATIRKDGLCILVMNYHNNIQFGMQLIIKQPNGEWYGI